MERPCGDQLHVQVTCSPDEDDEEEEKMNYTTTLQRLGVGEQQFVHF